jgi:hypothetical protein
MMMKKVQQRVPGTGTEIILVLKNHQQEGT